MRAMLVIGAAAALLLTGPSAYGLDGRSLTLTTTEAVTEAVAVSVPFEGAVPAGRVEVLHAESGAAFPATVRDGRLTFLVGGLPAETTHQLTVKVHPQNNPPAVRIAVDEEAGRATVHIRDEHFTTYNFGPDHRMPYLWPVYAEGGVTITRNFPMGEDEPVASTDHVHHQSLWTAFGDVNGFDTWHRVPIKTNKVEAESGDAYGWLRAENVWVDGDGNPIVDETREYHFVNGPPSLRAIDQTVTFTASHGEVTFADDKEGFFAFRIRPEIQGNRAGVLTNALGQQTEREVYGTPTEWMDYSGPVEGVGNRGIALFSHPENFRLPAWHVRDYGLVGCNFFALSDVARLGEDGSYTLAEGESLTLRARYLIHSGDVHEADIPARYAEYASPPEAEWDETEE